MIDKNPFGANGPAAPPGDGHTLRFYGRHWRVQTQVRRSGETAGSGQRLISQGELREQPDGEKVGEFCWNRFCLESAFGPNPCAASNLEFQTLQLKDGTLFGMNMGGPETGTEKAHAILGGTGRFAGARGSYIIQTTSDSNTPGSIEIVITLFT